jgi:hypothetical protein
MKTYKIVLLTQTGLKTEIYNNNESLDNFENRMIEKYKTFTMQSSKEIN